MKPTTRGGCHAALAAAVAAACTAAAIGQGTQSYSIKYVDADAPGGGNGSTWGTAYNDLESALAAARLVNVNEIRVGGGSTGSPDVYTPSAGSGRNARFDLVPAVGCAGASPDTGRAARIPLIRTPTSRFSAERSAVQDTATTATMS